MNTCFTYQRYIYEQLKITKNIVKIGECITRKLTDEEKVKYGINK